MTDIKSIEDLIRLFHVEIAKHIQTNEQFKKIEHSSMLCNLVWDLLIESHYNLQKSGITKATILKIIAIELEPYYSLNYV